MGKGKKTNPPSEIPPITDAITFKDEVIRLRDVANEGIQDRYVSVTMQFPLVQTNYLANLIAERELRKLSYPFAEISFKANRNMFNAIPGKLYKLVYPMYGITSMVVRVTKVEEEGPESELITIYAKEDSYYTGSGSIQVIPNTRPAALTLALSPLANTDLFELPYGLAGGEYLKLCTLSSREEGNELGYAVYTSFDGTTYSFVTTAVRWGIYGTLQTEYTGDRFTIDDDIGFDILFDNDDASTLESIGRAELFGNRNLALLGDEFISFQTITPVSTRRYTVTGILSGRYDTTKTVHHIGEAFYFIGSGALLPMTDSLNYYYGATRYAKYVPFNSQSYESLSSAVANSHTITKRAYTPYSPDNLKANDCGLNKRATYTSDIVLTWAARLRTGQGAGYGDIDTVTDASPTWEGYFRVRIYVGGSLVRTTIAINALTWTYTSTMNLSDNGSLASEVTVKVSNYITSGSDTYYSSEVELTVVKE